MRWVARFFNDGGDTRIGRVKIYRFNGTSWTQVGNDIYGEAKGDLSGWDVDINGAGDRVVIGARLNDGNGNKSGHARIFEYASGSWSQLGQDIDGEFSNDRAGITVTINYAGDVMALGSQQNARRGQARVFEYNGTLWTQLGSDILGESIGDQAGLNIDLNGPGDRLVIGARLNDGGANNGGHARVFEYNSGASSWQKLGSDLDTEGVRDDFGLGVALNYTGDRVIVGGRLNDGNGTDAGYARVFDYNGSAWAQVNSDLDGLSAGSNFGHRVAIDSLGENICIGAKISSSSKNKAGQAIVYTENASCPDNDNDGYTSDVCGGTDCDDNDSTIHPGAIEVCDGIDNNCNGLIDGNDSTLVDNVVPIAICQNVNIFLDSNGDASITVGDIDGGSSDDCSSVSLSATTLNFTCADIGSNRVGLTVTDLSGNSAICSADVTVNDTISPNAICQDITVYLDAFGDVEITAADVDAGSSDACGSVSLVAAPTTFGCGQIGNNTISLTITDSQSNTALCQKDGNIRLA